ncbi:MAG: hypothetical protein VX498_13180, partial [Myxococcota bacterium]|nr:hypothetical protein [Myxococcota bacterium]
MCTLRTFECLVLSFSLCMATTAQAAEEEEESEEGEEAKASEKPPPEAPAVQLTVTDHRARAPLAPVGPGLELTRRDLELIPGSFGDPIRALHSLPGVSGDTASRTSFFIRASPAAELRVEIDGIPLRRLSHTGEVSSPFHRDLVTSLSLDAAGLPVDRPQSLAGGLLLNYLNGPTDRLEGSVDLSLLGASGHLAVQLGHKGRHNLVLGARQSLLPAYLVVADALGAFEGTVPEADSTEGFLRWSWEPKEGQRIRATLLAHRDRLLFDDVDERYRTIGGAFDWDWSPSPTAHRSIQLAHASHHSEEPGLAGMTPLHGDKGFDQEHRSQLRLRLAQAINPDWTGSAGAEVAVITRRLTGQFDDWRALPHWVWRPHAAPSAGQRAVNSTRTWGEMSIWTRLEGGRGPIHIDAGVRLDLLNRSRSPTASPQVAVSLDLSPTTRLSVRTALVHQESNEPLLFLPEVSDWSLRPAQALHLDLGVAQELGGAGLLSALVWSRRSTGLVVYSDEPGSPGLPSNDGWGRSWGLQG